MQGQTKIQERLRGIQTLIHEIDDARQTSENGISKLSQNSTPSTIKQAIQDAEKEEVNFYCYAENLI